MYLTQNNGKISIPTMASVLKWSSYAIRKRLRELGLPIIRKVNKTAPYSAPKSNRIDWDDDLLKKFLPHYTIVEFQQKFMTHVSSKAIGRRAETLGISPKLYRPTKFHKELISKAIAYEFAPEQDQFIKDHQDDMSQNEIAAHLKLDRTSIWRHMRELGIKRDPKIVRDFLKKHLLKILPMGIKATRRKHATMSSEEKLAYRQRCSDVASKAFAEGKIKPYHGISQKMDTRKGGKFTTRSRYETQYAQMLETDVDVLEFTYEPFVVRYEHDGIFKSYIPDFLVFYEERTELIEVKPSRFINYGRNPTKFAAAEVFCIEENFFFKIVTEKELWKNGKPPS